MVFLYLAIALVVGYLLGSISFARIFTWWIARKDITKEGSKNPGTMNILRTRGFGEALLTLVFDSLKVGAPALAAYFIFNAVFAGYADLAYFVVAFAGIFGHCFPIYYKFQGGKGVASTFGMFLFNPHLWWLSIVMFVLCFVLFFFLEYGFLISHIFILVMSLYASFFFGINRTMWFAIIIAILWLNFILVVVKHRENFKRFFAGTENKVDFKERVFGKLRKKDKQKTLEEDAQRQEQSASMQNTGGEDKPLEQSADKPVEEEGFAKVDAVKKQSKTSTSKQQQAATDVDAENVAETKKKQTEQKKSSSTKKKATKEDSYESKKGKKSE